MIKLTNIMDETYYTELDTRKSSKHKQKISYEDITGQEGGRFVYRTSSYSFVIDFDLTKRLSSSVDFVDICTSYDYLSTAPFIQGTGN